MRKLIFLLSTLAVLVIAVSCAARAEAPPGNPVVEFVVKDIISAPAITVESPACAADIPSMFVINSIGVTITGFSDIKAPATIRKLSYSFGSWLVTESADGKSKWPGNELQTYSVTQLCPYQLRC